MAILPRRAFPISSVSGPVGRVSIDIIESPYVYKKGDPEQIIDPDPLVGSDKTFRFEISVEGEKEVIEGELLHSHAITYMPVMEEMIGTCFDQRRCIQMCDAPARVQCGGETGLALREHARRTESLKGFRG